MTSKASLTLACALVPFVTGCQAIYSLSGRNNTSLKYEKVVTANIDKTETFTYLEKSGDELVEKTGKQLSLRDEFLKARQDASIAKSDAALNREFFDKGSNFSDAIAEAWFNALFAEVRQHRYNLSAFNIVTATMTAALALADANSTIVGSVGLTQGLVNAEAQNYSANFLLTPQVHALKMKLVAARIELRDKILANSANFTSFDAAQKAFLLYDQTRTPSYVEDLLKKSADVVKFVVVDEAEYAKRVKINAALVQLAAELGVNGGLSADDAKGIYLLVHEPELQEAIDFKTKNPNLAHKVSLQAPPTGRFEETLRELNSLLDFTGYVKGLADQKTAELQEKQAQLAATAGVALKMAPMSLAAGVARDSNGSRVTLPKFSASEVAAIIQANPSAEQQLADIQKQIDSLKRISNRQVSIYPVTTQTSSRPAINVVPAAPR